MGLIGGWALVGNFLIDKTHFLYYPKLYHTTPKLYHTIHKSGILLLSYLILSYLVLSYLVLSYLVLSESGIHIVVAQNIPLYGTLSKEQGVLLFDKMKLSTIYSISISYLVLSCLILSCLVLSCLILSYLKDGYGASLVGWLMASFYSI